ncbi:uncharacterized protein KY384_008707 [Bacidia gigantensis]|uniref:uncharacterized protein n=1 Tax=Bacidia gigantensis TaxID=2732470 RepID=UPI001D03E1C0|nr:uncharacterized protein KY384_008707 [Bacidia gigantensis]KAG8526507.1 hypothetical protein KY384_008707 [Bacidia gigantensis]
MSWTVTCLWDSSDSSTGEITHLLTWSLSQVHDRRNVPSFTVSFRQSEKPSIVRFEPHSILPTSSNADFGEWRTPSVPFTSSAVEQLQPSLDGEMPKSIEAPFQPAPTEQKSLSAKIQEFKHRIKEKVDNVIEACKNISLCPKPGKVSYQGDGLSMYAPTSTYESPDAEHDELDGDSEAYDVLEPTRVEQAGAAQTRDLSLEESSTGASSLLLSDSRNGIPSAVILKSFFLSLTLLSLLTWVILRCRDPRRRADRAARREERRTIRLYRRAARHQAIKNWVWQARLRYGLVSTTVLYEEEKRSRVAEQDAVLEKMMEEDIRALRGTHNAVTAMTGATFAAEEGRSGFSLARGESSGHRRPRSMRSVSTLPGYESEGTQPPGYDEQGRRASMTEFTSDSSVISTSPRISRDGTNSEYDEKLEEFNLNDQRADGIRS